MSPKAQHFPVMSEEVVKYVVKKPGGFYIDCTFGGGGHSRQILSKLNSEGRVLAVDVDNEAVEIGRELEKEDSRFRIEKLNFENIERFLKENNLPKADGIIFDLGVSTTQIKTPERGFSYQADEAYLDMRMDQNLKVTAADILNNYSRQDLSRIFKQYGDIKNPSKLINNISLYRKENEGISTTRDFKAIIRSSCDARTDFLKLTKQAFQAVRIETNNEIGVLEKTLSSLHSIVNKEGIVAIITFHSLEEEVVRTWKRKFCDHIQIQDYAQNVINQFSFLTDGCIVPSTLEVGENWSSRSAKLWVAQKN